MIHLLYIYYNHDIPVPVYVRMFRCTEAPKCEFHPAPWTVSRDGEISAAQVILVTSQKKMQTWAVFKPPVGR